MSRWKQSYFVRESQPGFTTDWRVVTELPYAPYIHRLQRYYIKIFAIMLGILSVAAVISFVAQRTLLSELSRLSRITTGLPDRLQAKTPLSWLHTRVEELGVLTNNIRQMATVLKVIFAESEARYQGLFENTIDAVFVLDARDHRILEVNRRAESLTGHERAGLMGQPISMLLGHSRDNQKLLDYFRDEAKVFEQPTIWIRHLAGHCIPVSFSFSPMKLRNRDVLFGIGKDIRDRLRAEENLRLIAKVFESPTEGILITDARTRMIQVNDAFTKITGFREQEVLLQTPQMLYRGMQNSGFYQEIWRQIREQDIWEGELWNTRKDGSRYAQWLNMTCIRDDQRQVTNYIGVFIDITERKQDQDRIRDLAFFDALTGLPNRTLFMDRLTHAISKANRGNKRLALLFLDLDNFKTINDTLGHQAGDELLQAVTSLARHRLRSSDTFARLGGDEFTIILEDIVDTEDVSHVAQGILMALARTISLQSQEITTTASIGICFYPEDGDNPHDLMKNADTAMYRAKEQGKNRFQFFTPEMNLRAQARLAMEAYLRKALVQGNLMVYFQPQVNIVSNRVEGAEALLRWRHAEKGFISPDAFIPIAEETGLMGPIGEWVLEACCKQMRQWLASGYPPLRIGINISNHQFRLSNIDQIITRILQRYELSPAWFELELTERIVMDHESDLGKLERLKVAGFKLSIDDFGTGHSSLSYLRNLAVDRLKIDKSFIQDIATSTQSREIIQAIITMAHALKMRVTAEGVETEAQLRFIKSLGCEEYQGLSPRQASSGGGVRDPLSSGTMTGGIGLGGTRRFRRDGFPGAALRSSRCNTARRETPRAGIRQSRRACRVS